MRLIKYLLVLGILSSYSIAGTIDPSTPDSDYIKYGEKFHCVVKICGEYDNNTMYCASAVAIDDNHILTAAHVVNNSKSCYVTIKDKEFIISTIVVHKDFETQSTATDIAIGYCKENFKLDFYPSLYEKNDEVGKVCSISGYGLTGTFNSGSIRSDGKKRAGSNKIDMIYSDMLICTPSYRNSKDFTSLEFFIGSGDSGGGLFIDGKLAGINSCIMATKRAPKSKYGEESGHTRISKFLRWIDESKKTMASTPD